MKSLQIALGAILLHATVSYGQEKIFTGRFTASENDKASVNLLKITVENGNSFRAAVHLRIGSAFQVFKDKKDHSNDYTDIAGDVTGNFTGDRLEGTGTMNIEMNDLGQVDRSRQSARLTGTIKGAAIEGRLILSDRPGAEEEATILPFTAVESGNEKPELGFPAGKSPKVFDKGWVFSASFSLLDDNGKFTDLSDEVEWSGTATFNPSKGKLSRPVFTAPGKNKITLSVTYNGKKYKGEYEVEAVSHLLYGHTGSYAQCLADAHSCPACPHPVIGTVLTGSALILAGDLPAARLGDAGIHISCCGGNSFTIATGDNQVLIEGKPAAMVGLSQTTHCGGSGILIGGNASAYLMTNLFSSIRDGDGNQSEKKEINTDDELKTEAKGIIGFPGNEQTGITLFPLSLLKILENTKDRLRILLKYGSLLVNGNSEAGKKIQVELKELLIRPSGTKFLVKTDSLGTTIDVYQGRISIRQISTGDEKTVDAGFSYRFKNGEVKITPLPDGAEAENMRSLMSVVDSKSTKISISEKSPEPKQAETVKKEGVSFLSKNLWYLLAAAVIVITGAVLMSRKGKRKK